MEDIDQTYWVPKRRRGPLPTYYYHTHFIELLDFVDEHYRHVLLESHALFIHDFRNLPVNAQCLYVRLVNRKGRIFAVQKLDYPELGDPQPLLDALQRERFVTAPDRAHFDDVCQYLTRSELLAVLQPEFAGIGRSLKKAELVAFARTHADAERLVGHPDVSRLLVQRRSEQVLYLMYLYFGRIRSSLTQFTMRDLGLVKTQGFREAYEPRFGERDEALEHFYFASRIAELDGRQSGAWQRLSRECNDWPEPEFAGSAALRDRLAFRLGRALEKAGRPEAAIDCYARGESGECSERLVRLMLAAGNRDAAEQFLLRCLDNPRSDEEFLVANGLYERKFGGKKTTAMTDLLRESAVLDVDDAWLGAPEGAVAEHFRQRGCDVHRAENGLWRTLFGLLFWNELFGADNAAVHSPFEFEPACLYDRSFAKRHADAITERLAMLDDGPSARRGLLDTMTRHHGTPNGVFRWRKSVIEAVFALQGHAPPQAVRSILCGFCEDFRSARYGYPDLMLVENGDIRFVEVKAEGDQLRQNQMLRIRQLRAAGLPADVLRVRWVIDPGQDYVVVDVETTGGSGINHRVTEIGAVKVRGGEIVDTFQTLLNPQRSIPPAISRLTGITAEMVAGAPYFCDIADDFEAFLSGSIFVAHNVDFDYGFINSEFARIGRRFRLPKLCTCASMRRLYPGRPSYSLANLAREFDIPLQQHHRALSDASAAAGLLMLINEQRALNLRSRPVDR